MTPADQTRPGSPSGTSSGTSSEPSTADSWTPAACPACGADVVAGESFCEACGAALAGEVGQPTARQEARAGTEGPLDTPIALSQSVPAAPGGSSAVSTDPGSWSAASELTNAPSAPGAPAADSVPCPSCGGVIDRDGYCETCGTKAPSERDHYSEAPASWVAACCDRGIRHDRNEDAVAVAAAPEPGSRAVLVVCDGVSTSTDSDVASLAAARAARADLLDDQRRGVAAAASRATAQAAAITSAVESAHRAVIAHTAPDSTNPASCTLAVAVVEGDLLSHGSVGDSRVYWLADPTSGEPAVQLSVDDSMAQLQIAAGVSREEAEEGPQAHAIIKWLGRDSPDSTPATGSCTLTGPGWVLVCSDGLWNYASEAAELQQLVAGLSPTHPEPLALARALVRWANEQGGKDNITVALARHSG